jgi:hypothetical protein
MERNAKLDAESVSVESENGTLTSTEQSAPGPITTRQ